DGSGNAATGDRTGDHFGGIQAQRAGSSADLPGVLRVFGFINRCDNANCSTSTTLPGVVALGTVNVGSTSFTLQMIWDKPGNQFLFSLNGGTQHAVTYTASDSAEAILPFANINQRLIVANCHVARARASTAHASHSRPADSARAFSAASRARLGLPLSSQAHAHWARISGSPGRNHAAASKAAKLTASLPRSPPLASPNASCAVSSQDT